MFKIIDDLIECSVRNFKFWQRFGLVTFAVALLYFILGRIGFFLAFSPNVSAFWIPSGVAFSFILCFGIKNCGLGIFLGSLLINLWSFQKNFPQTDLLLSIFSSGLIATGSLLQAEIGAKYIKKFVGTSFNDIHSLFKFYIISILSCFISAFWGVGTLLITNFIEWKDLLGNLTTWYLGDLAGVLIVVPLFLTWEKHRLTGWKLEKYLELLLLFTTLFFLSQIVCDVKQKFDLGIIFLLLPVFTWAAIRYCQFIVAVIFFLTCLLFVFNTYRNFGPFISTNLNNQILLIQFFIITAGLSKMILSITIDHLKDIKHELEESYRNVENKAIERAEELKKVNKEIADKIAEQIQDKIKLDFFNVENRKLRELTEKLNGREI